MERPREKCKHCKKKRSLMARGLCRKCWLIPEIRWKYPVIPRHLRKHPPLSNEDASRCKHCKKNPQRRPRGLCESCYFKPKIRHRYPALNRSGNRGVPDVPLNAPLPEPIQAMPGTEAKVAELERRAAAGLKLWHPLDAHTRLGHLRRSTNEEARAASRGRKLSQSAEAIRGLSILRKH